MNNICILLTDPLSINEKIIIKSYDYLIKSKIKEVFFVGDQNIFFNVKNKYKTYNKFKFINIRMGNNKKNYLKRITLKSIELFNKKKIKYIINMPINKKKFLFKKYQGFTEFFSSFLDDKKNESMLLYNKNFSVCPITTHVELKKVNNLIKKNKLRNTINNIKNFYKNILKTKPKIIVLGLNPHAGKDLDNTKEKTVISSVINEFSKYLDITGPVSADTAFSVTKNKIFIGMYHDQVLIPFKMKNKFNGINITIGKKIIRMSPDHGTAKFLINKMHKINNTSFISCLKFCEKY